MKAKHLFLYSTKVMAALLLSAMFGGLASCSPVGNDQM